MQASAAAPSRVRALMTGESVQRLLALGALVILLVFFSIAVPHFASTNNYIDILTATAVNGVLAVGVTLVIITGGIDLSVGTAMTLCSVVAGLVSVSLGLPLPLGLLAALGTGALVGIVNGSLIAKAKLPPFIATLGMLYVTLGLAQVLSDVRPIYFEATQPGFQAFFMSKSVVGIPNIVWVMLGAAADRLDPAQQDDLRALHVRARLQRGGGAPLRRHRRPLEDHRLCGGGPLRGPRRHHHRLTHELGAAGPGRGLRARCDRRGRHRRHVPLRRRGQHRRDRHRRLPHQHPAHRPVRRGRPRPMEVGDHRDSSSSAPSGSTSFAAARRPDPSAERIARAHRGPNVGPGPRVGQTGQGSSRMEELMKLARILGLTATVAIAAAACSGTASTTPALRCGGHPPRPRRPATRPARPPTTRRRPTPARPRARPSRSSRRASSTSSGRRSRRAPWTRLPSWASPRRTRARRRSPRSTSSSRCSRRR